MKRTLITIALCMAIVAAGVAAVGILGAIRGSTSDRSAAVAIPIDDAASVKVRVLHPQPIDDALDLTGSVIAWSDVILSTELGGTIAWFGVDAGDRVTAGQELVRFDTSLLGAQLDEVDARLTLATQELKRIESLRERGIGAEADLDRAVAEKHVVESSRRSVRIQMDKSTVRAPLDGVVDRRYQEPGEFVESGRPLLRIVRVDEVKVVVGVPERDIVHFALGDTVFVRLDALPGVTFDGQVIEIGAVADTSTRTFRVTVHVPNPAGVIRPGMIARTRFVRQHIPDAIVAPMFSIISLDDRRVAMIENNGVAEMREVQTGVLMGNEVQITGGLAPGDHLIVAGQRDTRPGQRVIVTEVAE